MVRQLVAAFGWKKPRCPKGIGHWWRTNDGARHGGGPSLQSLLKVSRRVDARQARIDRCTSAIVQDASEISVQRERRAALLITPSA
jgi:hypothetical protein